MSALKGETRMTNPASSSPMETETHDMGGTGREETNLLTLELCPEAPEESASSSHLGRTRSPLIRSHTCRVEMPDGVTCQASYTRYGPCCHRFVYGDPLCRQIWISYVFSNTLFAIEQKAQELVLQAFRQAQEKESKQMQCKTRPAGHPRETPQIDTKAAAHYAGQYAACVRFTNGRLLPIGTVYADPNKAAGEIVSGAFAHIRLEGGQRLCVGICCRFARKWLEPRFLARFSSPAEPTKSAVSEPEEKLSAA